jgi:hypothetical protein
MLTLRLRSMAHGPSARAVPCRSHRRDVVGAIVGVPLFTCGNAWALIPDDDDEEMVEKAKANRQARLKVVGV